MIRVTYRPAVGEVVSVEIPEGRELEVLERAALRVYGPQVDAEKERASALRFAKVMAGRK